MSLARRAAPWLLVGVFPIAVLMLLLAGTRGAVGAPASRAVGAPATDPPPPMSIDITKTVGTTGPCPATPAATVTAGTSVVYCYRLRNTGIVTVDTHVLEDSHFGLLLDTVSKTVAPGGSMVVSVTKVATMSVTNVATWTSWLAGGPATEATDASSATLTVIVPQPPPSIVLTKTIGLNPHVCPTTKTLGVIQGTQVVFCFKIRNTGAQTLQLHSLKDAALGQVFTHMSRSIAPGDTTFFTRTATANVTSTAVATWTAWVTGTGSPSAMDIDSATLNVTPRSLALHFTKTVGKTNACAATTSLTANPGERVVYCYKVKNNSNVPLTLHRLVDDKLGTILNNVSLNFAPGQTLVYTRAATALITTTNTATWTSWLTNTASPKVVTTASAMVKTPHLPNLAFAKTVGTDPHTCSATDSATVIVGYPAVYCYKATNTGNVPLRLHTLEDEQFGVLGSNLAFTLNVGSSVIITKAFTAVITRTTVATWTAWETTVSGPKVRKTDTATLKVKPNPAKITLRKTVGVQANALCPAATKIVVPAGTTVYYCYEVQNTGTLTLPFHQLYDDDIPEEIVPGGFNYDLKPGEVVSTRDLGLEVSKTITRTTTNLAIWESYINDILYAQAAAQATVEVRTPGTEADLTVGRGACDGGKSIELVKDDSYSFCVTITNTGDITLTDHNIIDIAHGLSASVHLDIEPGQTVTVTRDVAMLGPFVFNPAFAGVWEATIQSWASPDGAMFTATDKSTVTLFDADASQHLYLPSVER